MWLLPVAGAPGQQEHGINPAAVGGKPQPQPQEEERGKDGTTEDALYCWFVNARAKAVPLSGPVLM